MAEDGPQNKEHTRKFISAVLKNPSAKEAALTQLLKDMKLEKASQRRSGSFETWK